MAHLGVASSQEGQNEQVKLKTVVIVFFDVKVPVYDVPHGTIINVKVVHKRFK